MDTRPTTETPLESIQSQIFDIREKISDGENLNLNNSLLDLHRHQEDTNKKILLVKDENERIKKRLRQFENEKFKLDMFINYVKSNSNNADFMLNTLSCMGSHFSWLGVCVCLR